MNGRIEAIGGCMFAGKTGELIHRVEVFEIAERPYLIIKPSQDNRYQEGSVVTHSGRSMEAIKIKSGQEDLGNLKQLIGSKVLERLELVAFDEGNFFSEKLVSLCLELKDLGKRVIVAGLDLSFRGEPFPPMPEIFAYANPVDKLEAVCMNCYSTERPAIYTQKLTEQGEIAPYNSPLIEVGGKGKYQARCEKCFKKPE